MTTLQADSNALSQLLMEEIQNNTSHSISFARFMARALYEPRFGYYTADLPKLGEAGDFVTAPEVSPLFAQSLGQQCRQVFMDLGGGDILEIGAGTGKMARDLLLFLEKKKSLPTRYLILEISANLRKRQQTLLEASVPHLSPLVEWLETWPVVPIKGVVIANEVLDALPVHKFLWTQESIQEMRVQHELHGFGWHLAPLNSSTLVRKLRQLQRRHFSEVTIYTSEVCLGLADWMVQLSRVIQQGLILILDYGYAAQEYYHPDRCQGTLMCYHQHWGHADPFVLIGLQDITASVDFSWLARCGVRTGLTVAGFTSQAAFLFNNGLLQHMEECYNEISPADINRQAYCLTSPNEMGERIRVMGFVRGYKSKVQGFAQYDRRTRL